MNTIRYATDSFKASNHDDQDWFERDEDINCVVVKKEDISYSKKVASLSNYKKTTVKWMQWFILLLLNNNFL